MKGYMEKYRKGFKAIQEVYDSCVDQYDNEPAHYEFALRRLQGLQLVACCDTALEQEDFQEIDNWRVTRHEAHE